MHNGHGGRALRPWLLGAAITAVMWGILAFFTDIHFATNDDMFILRTFLGNAPGGSPTFHYYLTALWVYPLHWLNQAFPLVPWYSYLQLLLLSLAAVTLLKSILQCFARGEHASLWGLLAALAFACLFLLYNMARVTFTVTAAMLGAAAAAQIISVDCKRQTDGSIVRSMAYALALLLFGYSLRQLTGASSLAYCGLAFLYQFFTCFGLGKRARRSPKPMLCALFLVAVVMGGAALLREAEIDRNQQREHLDGLAASSDVMDFMDSALLSDQALEAAGWTRNDVELMNGWHIMDVKFSAEPFRLVSQAEQADAPRLSAGAAIEDLRTRSPNVVVSMVVLVLLGVCLFFLLLSRRGQCPFALSLLLLTGGLCLLLFCYVALTGRLPYRAVMVPLLPAASIVFCLFGLVFSALPKLPGKVLCALVCLSAVLNTAATPLFEPFHVGPKEDPWGYNTFEDLDFQAVSHSDLLFLYSTRLVNDVRMFPRLPGAVPTNLMFWGGWQWCAPEYMARLAAFGIDGERFTARDWLKPGVRFVTVDDTLDPVLLAYLQQDVSPDVRYEKEQISAGLFLYRFYLP